MTAEDRAYNAPHPLPLPDNLDTDTLGRLLQKIEAAADAKGWDQPYAGLTLYLIYDAHEHGIEDGYTRTIGSNPLLGPPLRMRHYRAQPIMTPAWLAEADTDGNAQPWELARCFALNITYGPPQPGGADSALARAMMRTPGVLGFACCYEGWDRSHLPTVVADAISPRHEDWGDKPGSESARIAMAVDFLDQPHTLVRSQRTGIAEPVQHGGDIRGSLSTVLRVLTDMAYSRSPRPSRFNEHYTSILAHLARMTVDGDEITEVERIVNSGTPS